MVGRHKLALVLSGGGARGAYQAGVIKGLVDLGHDGDFKFDILSGVSAGAINTTFIAAKANDLQDAANGLVDLWSNLNSSDVYETSFTSLSRLGLKWIWDLSFGGLKKRSTVSSLLDTAPLHNLLEKVINFENIRKNLEAGHLDSIVVSATDYEAATNIAFYDSFVKDVSWARTRRKSQKTKLELAHVMASSAIPVFFPPIMVENRPFGDGCLRNSAPLSPAIKLGAEKILLVGVRKNDRPQPIEHYKASIGRILGVMLNSVFMESIEQDLERLDLTNLLLRRLPKDMQSDVRPVEYLYLTPSVDIGRLAAQLYDNLPRGIRYLIQGLGDKSDASEIVSYLMFEPKYCRALIDIGYADVMRNSENLQRFLNTEPTYTNRKIGLGS